MAQLDQAEHLLEVCGVLKIPFQPNRDLLGLYKKGLGTFVYFFKRLPYGDLK